MISQKTLTRELPCVLLAMWFLNLEVSVKTKVGIAATLPIGSSKTATSGLFCCMMTSQIVPDQEATQGVFFPWGGRG